MAAYSLSGGGDNSSTLRLWNSQKFNRAGIFSVGVGRLWFVGCRSNRAARDGLEYSDIRPIDRRVIGPTITSPMSIVAQRLLSATGIKDNVIQ